MTDFSPSKTNKDSITTKDRIKNINRKDSVTPNSLGNVVVVDDMVICQSAMELALSTYCPNFKLLSAYNGHEALEILKSNYKNTKLAILDFVLPDKTGIELYKEIQSDKNLKHIPIIFQSGREITQQERLEIYSINQEKEPIVLSKMAPLEELLISLTTILGKENIIRPSNQPRFSNAQESKNKQPSLNMQGSRPEYLNKILNDHKSPESNRQRILPQKEKNHNYKER